MFSTLLKHIRKQKEGSPQQAMLLQEAARQALTLPASFAVPALISALQVRASETTISVTIVQQQCLSASILTFLLPITVGCRGRCLPQALCLSALIANSALVYATSDYLQFCPKSTMHPPGPT